MTRACFIARYWNHFTVVVHRKAPRVNARGLLWQVHPTRQLWRSQHSTGRTQRTWTAVGLTVISSKGKGKEEYLYSAILYVYLKALRHGSHTANTPCLPFLRKRSPDGATPNSGRRHPIAAYYSSIDPEGMKGWVGLVGWPITDDLPTTWSPISYRSSAGQGKLAGQRPTFYHWATFLVLRTYTIVWIGLDVWVQKFQ